MAKPFVKWAGGKTRVLDSIRTKYPFSLGKNVTKYAEPFVGGGAVLFDLLTNYTLDAVYISDINRELILSYKTIRDDLDALIFQLKVLEKDYLPLDELKRKEFYYEKRQKYNLLKSTGSDSVELAALFIFLNKTCFNGLYRVNSKGEFNVPQGSYKNPYICDEFNLRAVSEKLYNVQIVCGSYQESINFIDSETFVYFDPPYRPLSGSSDFTAYAEGGFGDSEQIELVKFIDSLSDSGAYVLVSNSDPRNVNADDNFFDELYANYSISRIHAARSINAIGNKRGKLNELLITLH